jgi:hypothetical protein
LVIGLISAGCIFGAALLGMWLHKVLPERHLDDASKDTVKLGAGLLATLAALVLFGQSFLRCHEYRNRTGRR